MTAAIVPVMLFSWPGLFERERMRYTKTDIEADRTTITGFKYTGTDYSADLVSPYFKNEADAKAYAAMFPKWIRAKKTTLSGLRDDTGAWYVVHYVSIFHTQNYRNSKTSGGVNETGLKRLLAAVRVLRKNGIEIFPRLSPSECAMTIEELNARFLAA